MRYKTNDYSVPVAYGHRDVWIRGYVDAVTIGCGGDIIARHPRSYDREDTVFDPVHYLPLIEQKINALDQAAALAAWDLPPAFATLRRLMEARKLKAGRREYVQVLRLLETFELADLHAAVKTALRMGAKAAPETAPKRNEAIAGLVLPDQRAPATASYMESAADWSSPRGALHAWHNFAPPLTPRTKRSAP